MGFLTGKTAIITGAGRAVLSDGRCGSIGYGIATAYAKEGANIVITGRNESKLAAAKEELEKLYNIKVLTIQADVNASADNEAVVANVVKQTIDTFGHIDVLINNAQASASGVPLAEHTTEQFNLAMYSGLYAAFYYMKACYPYLKESKGSVINFASGAGLFGNFGQCAYAAAKEVLQELLQLNGLKMELMLILYALLRGHHSLSSSRTLIQRHLIKMFILHQQAISVMLSLKSDVYAYSLHLQTLSI